MKGLSELFFQMLWPKNDQIGSAPDKTLRVYSPLAGFLSYLVPGLGQIYQGRIGKGVLFFVCLYGMFFYGMYLASWSNVYLVDASDLPPVVVWNVELPGRLKDLAYRPHYAGQFWIGAAAWPALCQYGRNDKNGGSSSIFGNFQRTPPESRDKAPPDWDGPNLNDLQKNGDKMWDLAWVYTVIAGVLNILVIYDAFAGPAFLSVLDSEKSNRKDKAA